MWNLAFQILCVHNLIVKSPIKISNLKLQITDISNLNSTPSNLNFLITSLKSEITNTTNLNFEITNQVLKSQISNLKLQILLFEITNQILKSQISDLKLQIILFEITNQILKSQIWNYRSEIWNQIFRFEIKNQIVIRRWWGGLDLGYCAVEFQDVQGVIHYVEKFEDFRGVIQEVTAFWPRSLARGPVWSYPPSSDLQMLQDLCWFHNAHWVICLWFERWDLINEIRVFRFTNRNARKC